MLEHEETLRLIAIAKKGDNNAKSRLLEENKPLIKSIIRRYAGKGVEYDDLMQIASVGLLKAIANFSVEYNVRFSTYAVPMILGEVKRFMRDDGYLKVSRSTKTLSSKIYRYIEQLKAEGKTEPSVNELAEFFETDSSEIVFAMDAQRAPISLYEKTDDGDEQGLCLIDKLSDGNKEDVIIDTYILKTVIEKLNSREKKIILLRYYRDLTQCEIAKQLGVSQVQISRLENKIMEKIRKNFI
ncbi:MAG: SigB/SigF/SigG family RNA polymerase sigma factor [Clostridia bacterium]